MKNQKYLVSLLEGITKKQLFMFVWLFVGALFTFLILNFYRKSTQRNFKEEPFPRKPKPGMGLANKTSETAVSKKDETH